MPPGNSLIDLGDLSKPATVLIKKVSNAVGVLYEPRRIRKRAEAEADAERIKALASMELDELQQRAIDRLVHQETRKQENIESITAQAAVSLPGHAKVDELDEDWIAHFFKQCDSVSDRDMQTLWSRLLAGEATEPGTFSRRTVDFVASMDRSDALLFTELCQFCWFWGEPIPYIVDVKDDIYTAKGIHFRSLKHLDAIGLISFESASGYSRGAIPKHTSMSYFGRATLLEFTDDQDNRLDFGCALLTEVGKELAGICVAQRNEEFYQFVIERWYKQGLIISSLLPGQISA